TNADGEIDDLTDDVGCHTRPIVGYGDCRLVHVNRYFGSNPSVLGGVESIVHQFLDYYQRPSLNGMPDLRRQFLLGEKIEQPAPAKGCAIEYSVLGQFFDFHGHTPQSLRQKNDFASAWPTPLEPLFLALTAAEQEIHAVRRICTARWAVAARLICHNRPSGI